MNLSLQIVFLSLLLIISGCSNNSNQKTDPQENNPIESGPKATGPTDNNPIQNAVDSDKTEELNSKTLSGEWIVVGYNLENYVHYSGMNENQKQNFERIVTNLVGKMRFVFDENGDYEAYTGLPSHVIGVWFIDENGVNLTLQQKFNVIEKSQTPLSKTNVYVINKFSKNYLTLSDTDNLTFVFKKSK